MAAALSYYFVLSIFPALILFFAALASLPFPSLYTRVFTLIFTLLPAQAVPPVEAVVLDVLGTNHRAWLSLGTIGTIWIASCVFDAMIEAHYFYYNVKMLCPLWMQRRVVHRLPLV